LDRIDTAYLSSVHTFYVAGRKKEQGYLSDEVDCNIITDFCALRAKSYAFDVYARPEDEENRVEGEKIKAKRIRYYVVKTPT